MTSEALEQAQVMLNQGLLKSEVAHALDIKPDTFDKAIGSGPLERSCSIAASHIDCRQRQE
ncbi:hypothetical protein KJ656_11280 [bacterium]|nr:hypothetical protein [bacterium]